MILPNSVTSIGHKAFAYCYSLTSIEIPASVTWIGSYSFYMCKSITSIGIPSTVTSIGDWAFQACNSITSIKIPNSITSIGDGAFKECSDIMSIEIPNSVTHIGFQLFYECSSLTSIKIPNSITSIATSAFERCSNLKDIYYHGTEEEWKKISIGANNGYLLNANIHFNYDIPVDGKVSSDAENAEETLKCKELKIKLKEKYGELGRIVYEEVKSSKTTAENVGKKISEIDALLVEIVEFKEKNKNIWEETKEIEVTEKSADEILAKKYEELGKIVYEEVKALIKG